MTKGELIKKLQDDPTPLDAIMILPTSNFEQGNSSVVLSGMYSYVGKMVKKQFRDAFDGENYTSTLPAMDKEGDKTFINLY